MDIFNIIGAQQRAGGGITTVGSADGGGDGAPPPPPPGTAPVFTEEQQLSVLKFLDELDEQREKDPEAYRKNLHALGLLPEGGVGEGGDTLDNNKLPGLAEAIGQMRASVVSTPTMAVNLPGGKGVLGQEGIHAAQPKGVIVTPEPGFTVKTKVLPDGPKVFINLCTHEGLGEPSLKKRLNDQGEPVEGMNVPVSVGPMHREADKTGAECLVYDMIVHPKVRLQNATRCYPPVQAPTLFDALFSPLYRCSKTRRPTKPDSSETSCATWRCRASSKRTLGRRLTGGTSCRSSSTWGYRFRRSRSGTFGPRPRSKKSMPQAKKRP